MRARIYQPAKTATQSGRANAGRWLLEFESSRAKGRDPLMGWTSSADTSDQVRLFFPDREAAEAYAKKHGIEAELQEPRTRRLRPKSYADNFRWDRPR